MKLNLSHNTVDDVAARMSGDLEEARDLVSTSHYGVGVG